ncbi:MAG: hypothetical protein D6800_00700 [Candidatus Zixiibacteriota bacterium]|nr:MAG: hypothetical protein D6800_00700 [candidate division Zixibacteria bacterium]
MKKLILVATVGLFLTVVPSLRATDVSMAISGPGAVNDSTIKAGKKVSVDIYWANDHQPMGFTTGFKITSDNIKRIIHPADSGNGINPRGDVKGYNGWQDRSIWDLGGVFVVTRNWDGELPDTIGFGGAVVKKRYKPHPKQKVLSFDIIVPDTGTIVIDSSFFPPGGYWKFGPKGHPTWAGPYKFHVIK